MEMMGFLMFVIGYFNVIYISDHKIEGRYTKGYDYTKKGLLYLFFCIIIIGIGMYLFLKGGI